MWGCAVLTIDIQNSREATLLRCSGKIVYGDGADSLRRIVLSQQKDRILIDLSRIRAIDAAGLGALAALQRWANDSKRTIRLLNPTKRVREALQSTGLSSVLEISQQGTDEVTRLTA
jgi:anti-anti-sigma factor